LTQNVNSVFFGHTHESTFEKISDNMLKELIIAKGKNSRFWQLLLLRRNNSTGMSTISYKREKTKRGRFPSFNKYFEYLYLKNILGKPIKGPGSFEIPEHFYNHINSFHFDYEKEILEKNRELINEMRRKKVAFSMAPSACCADAKEIGFHVLTFSLEKTGFLCDCDRYLWKGGGFTLR